MIGDRKLFRWDTVVANDATGEAVSRVFEAYWSPAYVEAGDSGTLMIAEASAVEATWESKRRGKPVLFRPISAQLAAA